jgi:hypothetical protein
MYFLPFFDWSQRTPLALAIRDSIWAAPVIDILHVIGLAMVFGPVLIVNLRLLGLAFAKQPAGDIADAVRPWFWRGLALSFATGLCFFVANAIKAYNAPPFYFKMAMLGVGLMLQTTLIPSATRWRSACARVAAVVSMVVWIAIPVAGFWIELY